MRASACASPGKAEGGTGRPPAKKGGTEGGGGGGERTAHSHQTARQHHKRRPNPRPRRHRRQGLKRGTGGPPSQNRQHQTRNSDPPGKGTPKQADTHRAEKKKRASSPARKKGDGGTGTTRPVTGTASSRHQKAKPRHAKKKAQKTHPANPTKKGRGTAETRAQHARPHSAPQPGKAGNKRGARTTRARVLFPQQCYCNLKTMRPATATKRCASGKYHYRRQSFQLLENPISPDHGNLKCRPRILFRHSQKR